MTETTDVVDEPVDDNKPRELSDDTVIAQRSADIDTDEATDGYHVKVFVLPPGPKPTEENGFDHSANKAATRQYAISQGLRPIEEVEFVSASKFGPGKLSWSLKYKVKVVPADRFDYTPETAPHVVTDELTGDDGVVHTNTDGSGKTPSTSDKPTA